VPVISASEAGKRLGVNAQRIRALASQGRLPGHKVANRWVFDSELLYDHLSRPRADGRPFEAAHALGLLYLASGEDAPWLAEYDRWRLRRYIAKLQDVAPRLRSRAQVSFLRAPESLLRRIDSDKRLVKSGVSAAERYGADIAARGVAEVYASHEHGDQLEHRYALRAVPEASANLILHRVRPPVALGPREAMPLAVVALDLRDSADARTRRAGEALMRRLPRR